MKEFLSKITQKIKEKGINKIETKYLTNNSWFYINENVPEIKTVYIFRKNNELLISKNGQIEKGKWDNLQHATSSLIIEDEGSSTLFNIIYLSTNYMLLQQDGTEIFRLFIKQEKYESRANRETGGEQLELIFDDLKSLLNEETITYHPNIATSNSVKDQPYKPTTIEIENKEQRKPEFQYFDKFEILNRKIEAGEIETKDEETNLIIELQEREEEMIENKELCPYCKALNSIKGDGVCQACEK